MITAPLNNLVSVVFYILRQTVNPYPANVENMVSS
jgi:hypothetical protein